MPLTKVGRPKLPTIPPCSKCKHYCATLNETTAGTPTLLEYCTERDHLKMWTDRPGCLLHTLLGAPLDPIILQPPGLGHVDRYSGPINDNFFRLLGDILGGCITHGIEPAIGASGGQEHNFNDFLEKLYDLFAEATYTNLQSELQMIVDSFRTSVNEYIELRVETLREEILNPCEEKPLENTLDSSSEEPSASNFPETVPTSNEPPG